MTPALGPCDTLRSCSAERLLPAARSAADAAGVTRLADVTRLDRLGLPVWQAIRPMSRALSVHQGKGATDADAQVGAMLEAAESHAAEMFETEGPCCLFEALPRDARAPMLDDFAAHRSRPPRVDEAYRWVEAEDLNGQGALHLPFDLVSLDLTRGLSSSFDRSSNGVATGATRDDAIATALHEVVERDSVTEWKGSGLVSRLASTIDLASVPFPWFALWWERLQALGADLRCYHVPSITASPVIACEINDSAKDGAPYRAIQGRGCHPHPEIALFKALAEALQGRAAYIAGARDDLLPSAYATETAIMVAFGLPLPPTMDGVDFSSIESGPIGVAALTAALDRAGYGRIGVVELARPQGLVVVRAFVCGLGSVTRRRRVSLP